MRTGVLALPILLTTGLPQWVGAQGSSDANALPPPGFHHLHLNSTNPDAAIAYYTQQFLSTSKTTWGGKTALKCGKVYVLFDKVNTSPTTRPQSAIWHFGWHVID